jgi:hypothetical protein
MKRGFRAVRVAACAAMLTVCTFATADATAAVRLLQPAGDGMIAVCHALPLEATPYELRLVPNDGDLGGHVADLDRPLDPANLSWPDIIPAPQDGSGESYCPGRPPLPPDAEPPTDPVDPPADALTPTVPPPVPEPPVSEPPAATQPAPAPVTTTDPPADAPTDTREGDLVSGGVMEMEGAVEKPAPVTRLPVTGSGPASSGHPAWLPAGAVLLALLGASAGLVADRRARR